MSKEDFWVDNASVDYLAEQASDRLWRLYLYYAIRDGHSADMVIAELVRRDDPKAFYEAGLRLNGGPERDPKRSLELIRRSAAKGYEPAVRYIGHVERGEIP